MGRKTVDVEYAKMIANRILANEDPKRSGEREGVIILMEAILEETGNYKGFKYLPTDDQTDGTVREYL
jgi:hypothetical protein